MSPFERSALPRRSSRCQPSVAKRYRSARPSTIDGALADGLTLHEPVVVVTWKEGSEYVADATDLGVHAFGATEAEALTQLRSRIVEQFWRLEVLGDRLAPRMAAQRDRLRHALPVVQI
jgi:hypothetical protein